MNKTTIKISVLAFLGFMTYGYAQQQQDHNGKVGVNTTEPSATMDIRPNDENARAEAKTNEGIIAPKLSKTRIANIETPVEGTLVYATDNVYTGTNDKVAKITEKGYYFYNGTEWVKAGSNSLAVDGSKWTNDTANNIVKLANLSDGTTPRTDDNSVFIEDSGTVVSTGQYVKGWEVMETGAPTYHFFGKQASSSSFRYNNIWDTVNNDKFIVKTFDLQPSYAGALSFNHSLGTLSFQASTQMLDHLSTYRGYNKVFEINPSHRSLKIGTIEAQDHSVKNTYNNRTLIVSNYTNNSLDTKAAIGIYRIAAGQSGAELGSIDLGTKSGGNFNTVASIKSILETTLSNSGGKTSNISGALLFYTLPISNDLTNDSANPLERMRITSVGNVGIGTTTPTEKLEVAGSIKSTALAGTGNRPVYADASGKLVIGTASTTKAVWTPDTSSNSVKLAITSANGDRTTHPISITDEGMVRATSFQGVNGATIFPDYVFQKYYTGTSSIKADYHFKSLSQVEDFVKANGHLPGYKSAETIKAQGYVDLMETQLTNVEKIEELYLHSIEQDKALKAKESKIQELEAKNRLLESRLERLEKLIQ